MMKYSPGPSVRFCEFTNMAMILIRFDRVTYKANVALFVNASVRTLGINVFAIPIALVMDEFYSNEGAG